MASTSTDSRKRNNEDDNDGERSSPKRVRDAAFDEIAPSPSTSASTLTQKPCYDVFINHRGPDVKDKLASKIYDVLKENNVTAFLDSKELEYGDFLPTTLEATMRSALIHIAIFSENYAASPWCLAELSFMLTTGAKIIPVFYHLEPYDVRYAAEDKGIYVAAFAEHVRKGRYSPEKLQEWRTALKNASFYDGEIIKNDDDEMRLLKKIVNIALKATNNVPLVVANHPVGLEKIVQDFEMNTLSYVHGDRAARIVGIWGMGGSGKTTLAKYLYNKKSSFMKRSSFIFDVRDGATKGMLQNMQIQLLKDLGVQNPTVDNIEHGRPILTRHLKSDKMLIVLDDVDHVDQLDALLPVKDSLGEGSLIIVTTRENEVLKDISSVHEMKALDPYYAKQLFCQHAFSQPIPLNGFDKLVEGFLKFCNGLPLSLKVIAGQLYKELSEEYWESLLDKISRILPSDITKKLRVSYDALDDEEKEMFLDTACFFIGEEKSMAIEIWNGSGWSGLYSWQKLFNKCLVELDENNRIKMHDHLRDLGREIANQHSPRRLWLPQQITNVKKQTEGKTGIRGIKAVSNSVITWMQSSWNSKHVKSYPRIYNSVSLDEEGNWSVAPSLLGAKIFVIRADYFNKAIYEASAELVWVRWIEIGERNLPSRFSLKNLRVLELYEVEYEGEHHLEELWEADSDAPVQLRELVISGCLCFRRFPSSIGRLDLLKKIVLTPGNNLKSLPEEFGRLRSLEHLQLYGPNELSSLPTSFGNLRNLRFLDLSECMKLRMLPVSFKKLTLLQYLYLVSCRQLILRSDDFQNMTKLEYVDLSLCEQLEELPRDITNQASLRELILLGTNRLRELPINIGQLSRLQEMSIGGHLLTSLPTSVERLNLLENLRIEDCPIKCLPCGFCNLKEIVIQCTRVCRISFAKDCYPRLESLRLVNNNSLTEIEALPTTVKSINLNDCKMLKKIRAPCDLENLEILYIETCPELEELPSFARSTSLIQFVLWGCYRGQKIEGLENCTRLDCLVVETCWEVPGIQSLERVEKLSYVRLRANKGSAIERCIRTIKIWPAEISVCACAVSEASSLLDSLLSPDMVVDSFSNRKVWSKPKLKMPYSNGDELFLLCFVINCVTPQNTLFIDSNQYNDVLSDLEEGRWAWVGWITIDDQEDFEEEWVLRSSVGDKSENEVERGLVVRGEKQRVVEAFHSLWPLFQSR
ncbi:hypothetical protein SUGI_0774860 [Cryptomeria japonica]|uniref:disease resistance protein RPV1 n=1 Tax=Cryptomeria japonica TaxID=3369 RepID=UPI00241468B9|nr:disease resistance protein RPV1 [Cryptomeria japonica]GLJ38067.1 hypothetical protein SUGI_0774860 [Cryptomeria japonica]